MKTYLLTGVALVLLTGCSSTGMPSMSSLTHRDAAPASPRETFAYRARNRRESAGDGRKRRVQGRPRLYSERSELAPGEAHTYQHWQNTVKFTDAKEQLRGGTVADAASDASQLLKAAEHGQDHSRYHGHRRGRDASRRISLSLRCPLERRRHRHGAIHDGRPYGKDRREAERASAPSRSHRSRHQRQRLHFRPRPSRGRRACSRSTR